MFRKTNVLGHMSFRRMINSKVDEMLTLPQFAKYLAPRKNVRNPLLRDKGKF